MRHGQRRSHHPIFTPRMAARTQGIFYVATGIWSLISIDTFQQITGPKTDTWLVKSVGALVTAIGSTLIFGSTRRRPSVELGLVAVGSALGLAAVDVVYVARRRIAPVYLLDAAAELTLAGWWAATWAHR